MADSSGLFGLMGNDSGINAANIIRSRYRQPIAQAAMENADTGSIRNIPPTKFESWLNESGQRLMNPTDTIAQGVQNFTQQDPVDMGMSLLNGGMGGALGATVWHGSPHKFDKFDFSKIGTGEGAQAYGYGGYTAGNPNVAIQYQHMLSKPEFSVNAQGLTMRGDLPRMMDEAHGELISSHGVQQTQTSDVVDRVRERLDRQMQDALKANDMPWFSKVADMKMDLNRYLENPPPNTGYLYKIDLPDEHIAKMLDWDKPLSQQHPDVQAALQPMIDRASKSLPHIRDTPDMTGASIYQASQAHRGGNPEEVSAAMQQAGIPGIRYLDGGSRGAGEGSSNYVVFPGNEDMLTILERNNQPLVNALRKPTTKPEYQGVHQPPMRDSGAPLHDLTGGGLVYPDDIYSKQAAQYYGHTGQNDPMDRQTIALIQSFKNKPNSMVTMYRAVPNDTQQLINSGDWVTVNKAYAKDHGDRQFDGNYKILSQKVKASDLFTNGDSIHEFGYDPENSQLVNALRKPTAGELAQKLAHDRAMLPKSEHGLGLPAGNTAMDRAKAMEFNTPAYHGTGGDFSEFDPNRTKIVKGTFSTTDPTEASSYAEGILAKQQSRNTDIGSANVMPLLLNTTKYMKMKPYGWNLNNIESARDAGMKGAISQSPAGVLDTHLSFDPSTIRSRFAAFDPWRRNAAIAVLTGTAAPDLMAGENDNLVNALRSK